MPDYISEAITAQWGERCPEFAEGCTCCEAWRQYDRLRGALEPFARAAGYLTDANGWSDTDGIELCYDDGRRLSVIPLSDFRNASAALREALPAPEGK